MSISWFWCYTTVLLKVPVALVVKNLPTSAGYIRDVGSIPGLGRSPGRQHGNPLQYSCLENLMDRGTWRAMAHRVAKSQTWLKWLSVHAHMDRMAACYHKPTHPITNHKATVHFTKHIWAYYFTLHLIYPERSLSEEMAELVHVQLWTCCFSLLFLCGGVPLGQE